MKNHFDLIRVTRNNALKLSNSLNINQLNKIPEGFRNNIAWNIAHMAVTMELLCYGLSGLPMHLDNEQITAFRKGSSPEMEMTQRDFDLFCSKLESGVDQLEADYKSGLFKEFKVYPTSYGVTLHSVEEAINFNYVHEALHLGYIMALRKLV